MFSSQNQKVNCWKCSNLFDVNCNQEVAQCPKCKRYNRVPNGKIQNNINHSFIENSNGFENDITTNNTKNIIICPFCHIKNLFRREADELICYKCSKIIRQGTSPSFLFNTEGNQDLYDNKKIIGWRIVPTQNILSLTPNTPPPKYESNTDYLLKKILKSLEKQKDKNETNTIQTPIYNPYPTPTFIPFPVIDYYSNRRSMKYIDDDYRNDRNYNINSKEIRYIPIKNEKKEDKDGCKITIRKKSKRGQGIAKSTTFEKVFYSK